MADKISGPDDFDSTYGLGVGLLIMVVFWGLVAIGAGIYYWVLK